MNDAPVIDPPNAAATTNEDTPLAFSGGQAISVTDVDAGENAPAANDLDVTLTIPAGTLSVGLASGVTVTGNGTGAHVGRPVRRLPSTPRSATWSGPRRSTTTPTAR